MHKKMTLVKERRIAGLVFALSSIFLIAAGYLESERESTIKNVRKFGFERTFVVSPMQEDLVGPDASDYISNAPSVSDGIQAVVARKTATKLSSSPHIEKMFVMSRTVKQLQRADGKNVDVTVFNAHPSVLQDLNLDNSIVLRPNSYTPSISLSNFLNDAKNKNFYMGVSGAQLAVLPSEIRDEIDWSKARAPVNVSDQFILILRISVNVPTHSGLSRPLAHEMVLRG